MNILLQEDIDEGKYSKGLRYVAYVEGYMPEQCKLCIYQIDDQGESEVEQYQWYESRGQAIEDMYAIEEQGYNIMEG